MVVEPAVVIVHAAVDVDKLCVLVRGVVLLELRVVVTMNIARDGLVLDDTSVETSDVLGEGLDGFLDLPHPILLGLLDFPVGVHGDGPDRVSQLGVLFLLAKRELLHGKGLLVTAVGIGSARHS